ncbi:MAG: type II toxin-antitoxin system RelE/ParE family toxin [Paludibacteraceae bacterium]|nr:type II toxin-antitoxin system RelE/ParE family toxin [Paludibacteraceae bacterium]
MTRREVKMTDAALYDLFDLDYTIREEFLAPLTAERYLTGLKKQIIALSRTAELGSVQPKLSFDAATEIRRTNYKKMAILYSIEEDVVYVHRIIPQSMVIY